jgi:subtilisin family serine protease
MRPRVRCHQSAIALSVGAIVICTAVVACKHTELATSRTSSTTSKEPATKIRPAKPRPIYLTIRLRPDVSATTLHRLREVAEPDVVPTESGITLHSLIKETYGVNSPALRDLVVDANPEAFTNDKTPKLIATSVTLPAGPKVERGTVQTIHFSGTLRQLAQITMGTSGEKTKATVLETNPHLSGKWDSRLRASVDLPYITRYSSYTMKTSSLSEAQAIARELKSQDPAVISAEVGYGFEAVPNWKLATVPSFQVARGAPPPAKWPFQNVTDKMAELEQSKSPRWALVAIVDTGLARGMEDTFPLWENTVVGAGGEQGELSDRCQKDYYGCNFITASSPPTDDCEISDEYHHGTHIAGLASGRLYAGKDELDHLIRLMILKAADDKATLQPDNISNALIYAVSHSANIVNLSLTGGRDENVERTIVASPAVLFVAAAGNPTSGVGADLGDPNLGADTGFPARLSGDRENVIGVASHDSLGTLSSFSNFGKGLIDLAAPGEQVPSLVNSGESRTFNGTSQATALVTLTAALLFSQNIILPKDIKHRILASTDFNPSLKNKVSSEGELNLSKALQYKSDLVQFKDGHVEAGVLVTPTRLPVHYLDYNVTVRLRENLYKIVPHYSDEEGKQIRVTFLRGNRLAYGFADSLGKFTFIYKGESRDISPDEVVDIIPRFNGADSTRR